MAREPLGITLSDAPDAVGVYEDAAGVEVFVSDDPYLTGDGKGLQAPLPVKVVEGKTYTDSMGNVQAALAVTGLPDPEED